MEYNQKEFMERLHALMYAHGMNNRTLARTLGMAESIVSHWDAGTEPKITTLAKICKLFHVNADFMLFGKRKEPTSTLMIEDVKEKNLVEEFRRLTPDQQLMVYGYTSALNYGNQTKKARKES